MFGKDDVSKLNKKDLGIMGQYLNVERRKAFKMNATIMFASWLERVAEGKLVTIEKTKSL